MNLIQVILAEGESATKLYKKCLPPAGRRFLLAAKIYSKDRPMFKKITTLLFILGLLVGCSTATPEPTTAPTAVVSPPPAVSAEETNTPEIITLRLMTHDSFAISEEVLQTFEAEHHINVEILASGDGAEVLNQAILAKDNPLADVLFGVDNTFLSRALENEIFQPYNSPELAHIADEFKLDPQNGALPVDYGDVCLNYDKAWFTEKGLTPPSSLADLALPEYANLTVVQNPATSTPGLAFLLATIATYGEEGYLGYWQSLVDNGVLVTDGWSDAYYGQFTAASEGDRPIVVSYASSPPAEVFFAEEPPAEAPTAAVVSASSCFRQIEFVGILQGTPYPAEAQKLIDFMLSVPFQEDVPLNMFVYPVNSQAQLPEVFVQHSVTAEKPATLTPEAIATGREEWLQAWTQTVLR